MIKIAYVECKGEQESDAKIEGILVCAPLPVVGILHLTAVGVVASIRSAPVPTECICQTAPKLRPHLLQPAIISLNGW